MKRDIFDKLALKNKEDLSAKNYEPNTVLGISRSLDSLKINDDFSNNDIILDKGASNLHNSYIPLNDSVPTNKKFKLSTRDEDKADLASYPLKKKI